MHLVPESCRGAWHTLDTCHAFFALSLRQQVVADAPEQQLQPLGRQCFCPDHSSEPALERREHRFHYAAPVVRIFKLFRVLLLPPDHLCPWTESPCDVVPAGADDRPSACITDHLVVLDCVISCIKHHAPRAIRNIPEHPPEHWRVVRASYGDCAGDDLSSPGVNYHMQFDEFTPGDESPLGVLPVSVLVYGDPGGVAQEGTARRLTDPWTRG